jgi:hypothetical protein
MEDITINQGMIKEVTREEVEKAVSKRKNNMATGPDEIPVEAWKYLGELGIDKQTQLLTRIWNEEEMPRELRDSVITPIYIIIRRKNMFKTVVITGA